MGERTMLHSEEVTIQTGEVSLHGGLTVPDNSTGIVIFAHGSGSGRFSPRNRAVASVLSGGSLSTLLLDLLTSREQEADDRTAELRFNIRLLGERLIGVVDWALRDARTADLPVGLFGASTGAAAALMAAAARPEAVKAVVSRGGRPDLAPDALPLVQAPTLLIVGGDDTVVIGMNEQAASMLRAPYQIRIIPGASHLFEEPGRLEQVASLSLDWFLRHLGG